MAHRDVWVDLEMLILFKTFDSDQSFGCSPPRDSHYHWFKTPPPPHEENILGCCLWLIIKVALRLKLGGLWLIIEVAHNLLRAVTLWPVRTFFSPQTCTSVLSNKGQSPVCESSSFYNSISCRCDPTNHLKHFPPLAKSEPFLIHIPPSFPWSLIPFECLSRKVRIGWVFGLRKWSHCSCCHRQLRHDHHFNLFLLQLGKYIKGSLWTHLTSKS